MEKLGLGMAAARIATTMEECLEAAKEIGSFPLIIRPAFTLGGTGGGIAYNLDEFKEICNAGLTASMTSQVQVEQSLLGWKEFELEVMRDLADNVVIICSIENVDPMGVHTGDSITVAPAQTLTDKVGAGGVKGVGQRRRWFVGGVRRNCGPAALLALELSWQSAGRQPQVPSVCCPCLLSLALAHTSSARCSC